MHGPADWAAALSARPRAEARVLFSRLGVVANCKALSSSELAECFEIGGERGARHAIYLACPNLREAGEFLRGRGQLASAFDITENIAYSDAFAAAGIITRLSGGGSAEIRLLDDDEDDETAVLRGMDGETGAMPWQSPFLQALSGGSGGRAAEFAEADSSEDGAAAFSDDSEHFDEDFSSINGDFGIHNGTRAMAAHMTAYAALEGKTSDIAEGYAQDTIGASTDFNPITAKSMYAGSGGLVRQNTDSQTGSALDADAFARVLADKLRSAASNT